ncbi:MAG: hypothetical protein J7M14_07785, partial [Planctomycetes bacterium]|nr:hypothetical protein [Planctomycetota bacterium]
TILGDLNYDTHTGQIGRSGVSLNVERNPRLAYFTGLRYIRDLDSSVGTIGINYKLSEKYSLSFFEQYDFDFMSGDNLATRLTFTRRLARWFVSVTFIFDKGGEGDDIGIYVSLWPLGVPEVHIGSGSRGFLSSSELN